jgi:beta-1,4-mannosyltransferase
VTSNYVDQNPPSLPTLPVVQLAVFVLSSRLIIDWHNTGQSVLGLRLGDDRAVTKLAGRYGDCQARTLLAGVLMRYARLEGHFGRNAFAHLFVTEAMRSVLVQRWRLKHVS